MRMIPRNLLRVSLLLLLAALSSCGDPNPKPKLGIDLGILVVCLATAGILAGLANYFLTYLSLPMAPVKPADLAGGAAPEETPWPKTKTEGIAILGYLVVGTCGALITPVINAIVLLKGLQIDEAKPAPKLYYLITLGYGLVFGYSASQLFSRVSSLVQSQLHARLTSIEKKVEAIQPETTNVSADTSAPPNPLAVPIEDQLKALPDTNYNANHELVLQLAKKLHIALASAVDTNNLVKALKEAPKEWAQLDLSNAKGKLTAGQLVLCSLEPPSDPPRLAVITAFNDSGEPIGYWGETQPVQRGRGKLLIPDFATKEGLTGANYYCAVIPNTIP